MQKPGYRLLLDNEQPCAAKDQTMIRQIKNVQFALQVFAEPGLDFIEMVCFDFHPMFAFTGINRVIFGYFLTQAVDEIGFKNV